MKKIIIISAVILLIISVSFAIYPTASRLITKHKCENDIKKFDIITDNVQEGSYEDALEKDIVNEDGCLSDSDNELPVLFKEDLERLYSDSLSYNNNLHFSQMIRHSSDFEQSALNLRSYGITNEMYGYINIPCIELSLPIYLGATDYNMRNGAAHLNATSLPIGGENTNTVLAGHTGYSGKTFFDNIKTLTLGDKIVIKNYFDTLKYEVCDIQQIENDELSRVFIQNGKDYVSLLTCSNGGTTRLLVVCERVE